MDDLISRQELLKRTTYNPLHVPYISTQDVLDCPSAQQWIPCSERLPECDYTDVLICVHDKRKGCENDFYVIQAYTVGKHWEPTLAVDMTDFDVVAWMPLPEPYKGENDG